MNIEFKYDKGSKRLVVSNEFGQLTEREYFDNIGELLIQENIIEETQKTLEENSKERTALLKEIKSIKSQIKSHEQEINLQKEEESKEKDAKKKQQKGTLKIFLIVFGVFTIPFGLYFFSLPKKTLNVFTILFGVDVVVSGLPSVAYYYLEEIKRYTKPFHYYSIEELEQHIEELKLSLKDKNDGLELNKIQARILAQILEKETQKYEELQEIQSREKENQMENNNQITKVEYRARLERLRNYIINRTSRETICEYDNDQGLVFFLNHKMDNNE